MLLRRVAAQQVDTCIAHLNKKCKECERYLKHDYKTNIKAVSAVLFNLFIYFENNEEWLKAFVDCVTRK